MVAALNRGRAALVPLVVMVLSLWWPLGHDPLPYWERARQAIPAIVAGRPVEQTGEREELNELLSAVAARGSGPVLFVAPNESEETLRAFYAAYVLFPRRVVRATAEVARPQRDPRGQTVLTSEILEELAGKVGADSVLFWKTPIPAGYELGREVLALPDRRWAVFLR